MANNNKKEELENRSNLKSKLFIVIVFLIAILFAVISIILHFQNKKLESKLLNVEWKIEHRKSDSIIEDKIIQLPNNSAEYIGSAKEISEIIRKYYPLNVWQTIIEGLLFLSIYLLLLKKQIRNIQIPV